MIHEEGAAAEETQGSEVAILLRAGGQVPQTVAREGWGVPHHWICTWTRPSPGYAATIPLPPRSAHRVWAAYRKVARGGRGREEPKGVFGGWAYRRLPPGATASLWPGVLPAATSRVLEASPDHCGDIPRAALLLGRRDEGVRGLLGGARH